MMVPLCRQNKRIQLYKATWKVEAVYHERTHVSKITINSTIRSYIQLLLYLYYHWCYNTF